MTNISVFVAGLMLGLVVGVAWRWGDYLPPFPTPATAVSTSTASTFPPASGAVSAVDQSAGNTVLVESVTVPPPGVWVAVQSVNEDGTLGNVLGASRVRGPASNVSVALLRPTIAGGRYAVVLYRDDGDNLFNRASDSAYVDFDTGAPVEELFLAH